MRGAWAWRVGAARYAGGFWQTLGVPAGVSDPGAGLRHGGVAGRRGAARPLLARPRRACVRARVPSEAARLSSLSVLLSLPQLGNPSPGPGGEATSSRRPGVLREQPGGSAAPGVTVGSWWELLRLEPQDFKGPVSVVFTFRILAKLGKGTILPLTPSHRGRAGERVSKYRSGAEGAKTLLREVKLLLGTWVQIPLFIRNWRSTFEGHWSQNQAFLQVSEVHGMGWKFKQLLNPLTENSLPFRTSFTLHIDAVVPLWSLVAFTSRVLGNPGNLCILKSTSRGEKAHLIP